jgi:ATP dependent DNA ligase C terminal region
VPQPNIAVGYVDARGRVHNPHLMWLVEHSVAFKPKGRQPPQRLFFDVLRRLTAALVPYGADPGGLVNALRPNAGLPVRDQSCCAQSPSPAIPQRPRHVRPHAPPLCLVQNWLKRLEASLDGGSVNHFVRISTFSGQFLDSFVAFLPLSRVFSADSIVRAQAIRGEPGFTGNAPGGPSRWSSDRPSDWQPLRTELVVEVSYDQVTDGRLRHGTRLRRWRPDKMPRQRTREQLQQELRPGRLMEELFGEIGRWKNQQVAVALLSAAS